MMGSRRRSTVVEADMADLVMTAIIAGEVTVTVII
jgi:hypothetical protein